MGAVADVSEPLSARGSIALLRPTKDYPYVQINRRSYPGAVTLTGAVSYETAAGKMSEQNILLPARKPLGLVARS